MTPDEYRRALAFNAVGPALNAAGRWLPLSVRRAVAEAVLAAIEPVDKTRAHASTIIQARRWATRARAAEAAAERLHAELDRLYRRGDAADALRYAITSPDAPKEPRP